MLTRTRMCLGGFLIAVLIGLLLFWVCFHGSGIPSADPARLEPFFQYILSQPIGTKTLQSGRTFHLDGQNGDDGWDGSTVQPASKNRGPWKTLGHANTQLQPGDTLQIEAGTYDEAIRPNQSGTKSATISYLAAEGNKVVITRPVDLADRSCIALQGLRFHSADGTSWLRTDSRTHHVRIEHCLFDCAASRFKEFAGLFLEGHHYILRLNVFGRGMGDQIHAPHTSDVLIEDNDFSQAAADHALITVVGENVVIRGNYFRNPWARVLHLCWNKDQPTRGVLVENNLFVDCDWNRVDPHPIALKPDRGSAETVRLLATNGIFRNNLLIGCNPGNNWPIHAVLGFQTFQAKWYDSTHYERLRLYHNTFFQNKTTAVLFTKNTDEWHLDDLVFKNNIIADSAGPAIRVDNVGIPWQTYRFDCNILTDTQKSSVISLPDADAGMTVGSAQDRFPNVFQRNVDQSPRFRDTSLLPEVVAHPENFGFRDLRRFWEAYALQQEPPGIRIARPLTTVTAAATDTTTLQVDDTLYFCDGLGLVPGDTLLLGDAGEAVVRKVVDGQTLEVDRPVTVRLEDPVYWKRSGRRPDIGIVR